MGDRRVSSLIASLAQRDRPRTEAMVQADVRELLLTAPLGLAEEHVVSLESQVGNRRRVDVEVGFTVIEVKKDLRKGKVRRDAERQLAGYVRARAKELGQRYVGVLTDGAEWVAYHLRDDVLVEVSVITVAPSRPDVDGLLVWLEGVLATTQGLRRLLRKSETDWELRVALTPLTRPRWRLCTQTMGVYRLFNSSVNSGRSC